MNAIARKNIPEVRKPDFSFSDLPRYYMNENPVSTHFINSLHLIFPDGEKYFIRSVKAYSEKIKDPLLKERVKAFISQEAQHMSAHKKVWEKIRMNHPMSEKFLEFYNFTCYEILEPITRKLVGDAFPLAITAALEHYTAVMAEVALRNEGEIISEIYPDMKHMLYWHAAEEIEHKSVAYDVYQELVGDYTIRILGMIYASVVLSLYTAIGHGMLLVSDTEINILELPRKSLRFGTKAKPLFENILGNLLDYFRIDFHPDDRENEFLANSYLEKKGNW